MRLVERKSTKGTAAYLPPRLLVMNAHGSQHILRRTLSRTAHGFFATSHPSIDFAPMSGFLQQQGAGAAMAHPDLLAGGSRCAGFTSVLPSTIDT